MQSVPDGYRLGKQLHSTTHSEVYEAVRESGRAEVVLKGYLSDRASDPMPRARREYAAMLRVAGPGIPAVLGVDDTTERPLLVLERVPGLSLAKVLREGPLDLATWLELGSQACETLARIHDARLLHKDLTPGNLLLDRNGPRVWICDFGLSVELGAAERGGEPLSGTLAGTLQYLSPEQTGRMNRGCDFRSDLYSLGASLYHALTGRPPFESDDALELIHAHLARVPRAPIELRTDLPRALSDLVLKLLRKEPEERYQSARALRADLQACAQQLRETGRISDDFVLGAAEAPTAPHFRSKLYGRERETELLRSVYADAASGRPRTLWIQGAPGMGKSALVDQLRPLLAQTHAYLVTAKFDLYADRPYAGWITALTSLVQQLLIESDARLARWRSELSTALGPTASALVDLVPDLAFILGEVPAAPRLEPREAQARLSLALQRFVQACATTEHPLVIFLDDLQWSDAASRALLAELLASPPPALLLIGAYRDGHAPALDALLARVPELTAPQRLELGALPAASATAMLADALERRPGDVQPLAEFIERRTANLPLLIQHFVEHIHERGLLRYVPGTGWSWDPDEIARTELPDSAVALMAGKLERLAPETRAVVLFASCVGDEFDTELLCQLSRHARLAVWEALCAAADAGLIIPCANGFRFAHDRIRESAQQQLSAEERGQIHCDTARLLLERTPDPERSPRLVQLVEHLNRVPELPEDLRLSAIRLNCATGKVALARGAFAAAADNFAIARRLLRSEDRTAHAPLAFDLFLHSADAAYQLSELPAALELLEQIDARTLSRLELAFVEAKRIQILAMCRSAEDCVRHALGVLRGFGVRWPLHPSRLRAQLALWRVEVMLWRRRHPEILAPARSVKPSSVAVLVTIRPSAAALARVDVHLAVLATALSMRHHLSDGYMTAPGFALAVYATYLYLFLGARERARRMAETALFWTERMPDPTAARSRMMIQALLYPFLMRRRQALAGIDRIVESARENGDPEFAHYARFNETCYLALAGDPIESTAKRFARIAEDVRDSQQWYPEAERCLRVFGALAAPALSAAALERSYTEDLAKGGVPSAGQAFSSTLWLLVLCTFGRHDLAFAHSERLADTLFRISPFVHVVDHTFYRGLSAAALASTARGRARRRYLRVLRWSLRYLKRRARDGPDFVHMELLLRAEQARLSRDPARARTLYEKAAERATQQSFAHHTALAQERHALYLASLRRDTEALPILRRALVSYREWGALGKAALLAGELDGNRMPIAR